MPIIADRPYITIDGGHLLWAWENSYGEPFNPSTGSSLNRTDDKKCYICYKKLTNRSYIVKGKHNEDLKVCSNCEHIYKFLTREIIEYNNNISIVRIKEIALYRRDKPIKGDIKS